MPVIDDSNADVSRTAARPRVPGERDDTDTGRGRVLVIDDDDDVRACLVSLLETAGFRTTAVGSGRRGIDAFRAAPAPVVMLDLQMPELNGMQVLPTLLAIDPDVAVIILTGHGDVDCAVEAMRIGAWDFLTKPTSVDTMIPCIRRAFEHRGVVTAIHVLAGGTPDVRSQRRQR